MQNTHQNTIRAVIALVLFLSLGLGSCNYTRHLGENDLLLKKNEIKFITDEKLKNEADLSAGLNSLIYPQPNSNLLETESLPRYKLWRYNQRYKYYQNNPRAEKIRKRKVEPPSLVNPFATRKTDSTLKQYMVNNGFFYAQVGDSIVPLKNKEAKVIYAITPGKKYYIKEIIYQTPNEEIKDLINLKSKASILKKGKVFRNTDFGNERERLYTLLRKNGYYALKAENISCELDTIDRTQLLDAFANPMDFVNAAETEQKSHDSINVYINFNETRESKYKNKFKIGKVFVTFNDFQNEKQGTKKYEVEYKDLLFRYDHLEVNKNVIVDNIFIHPGDMFSTKSEAATYNRLNQLGTFQFVNIQYERSVVDSTTLDCYLSLTMAPRQDFQINPDLSTSEDYILGIGLGINYNTKNLLKGANKLSLSAQYTIENRLADDKSISLARRLYLNANNLNVTANLSFPKFLLPFKLNHSRYNFPQTNITLAYNRVNRINIFRLVNTIASIGYGWKETENKSWLFTPLFLSYTHVPQSSLGEAFQEQLANSSFLRNTYSNNFILGEAVSFEYKSDITGMARISHNLKLGLEEAGTVMQGVNAVYQSVTSDTISPIAHYLRADIDYRYYLTKRKYQWASRAMIGLGLPTYGDQSLPYIKQYSQGGAFSNRGWRLRSLGPGRQALDTSANRQIVDRTGDLKLELNTELRFKVTPLFGGAFNLNGAAFLDAGNIWLWDEDSTNVGAKIDPAFLWQDIAISAGLGVRLDFSFFVFRIDHGWPLKHPYILTNSGWDLKGVRINSGQWNLSIGYPF
jgi:outer membrane protein insertion porin family